MCAQKYTCSTTATQEEATKGLVHLEDIQLEVFDLGDSPLRVAGLKRYSTSQDEVIVDMPVQWGSQVDIRYAEMHAQHNNAQQLDTGRRCACVWVRWSSTSQCKSRTFR